MNDKTAVIGMVVVVVIVIVGFMLYNYQQQAQLAAMRGGTFRQILGGVGGAVDGLLT